MYLIFLHASSLENVKTISPPFQTDEMENIHGNHLTEPVHCHGMRNLLVSSCVRAYQESDYENRSVYRDLHLVKDFDHDHHDLIEIAS